ncbi:hypothetical protein G3O00_00040 [Burkholderia sp. Ac-20384]|uniref:hypothetical protein n=1 Tax=Burkholderia sp. Ac-20384 TaxID=2703902 RepID=UPI0019814FFB|nr:hypothetical protein [Burkholderia sp. Ac-20384]MBN3822007.1 hypothetical protein [Burkholderia sp. Ac-20384]
MFLHPVSEVHHGNVGGPAQAGTPFLAVEVLRDGKPLVGLWGVQIRHLVLCNDLRTTKITQPSHPRAAIDKPTRAGG